MNSQKIFYFFKKELHNNKIIEKLVQTTEHHVVVFFFCQLTSAKWQTNAVCPPPPTPSKTSEAKNKKKIESIEKLVFTDGKTETSDEQLERIAEWSSGWLKSRLSPCRGSSTLSPPPTPPILVSQEFIATFYRKIIAPSSVYWNSLEAIWAEALFASPPQPSFSIRLLKTQYCIVPFRRDAL